MAGWAYRPATIFGIQHLFEKGFCNCCYEHVQLADQAPQMTAKGAADASLLAHLTTSKQGDHLPLYRYEEISLRNGWWIPRSTQAGWLSQTAATAVILYAWMASRILQGKLIGTDATGVPVLDPGAGQVRKGTIWTYCGQREVCPYLIYDYWPSGEGEAPRRFLQGYKGYLQADAASVFDQLYLQGSIQEVASAAHMRRYFYKARHAAPGEAHYALAARHLSTSVPVGARTGRPGQRGSSCATSRPSATDARRVQDVAGRTRAHGGSEDRTCQCRWLRGQSMGGIRSLLR